MSIEELRHHLSELAMKYQVRIGQYRGTPAVFFRPFYDNRVRLINTIDPISEVAAVIAGPMQNPYGAKEFEAEARKRRSG